MIMLPGNIIENRSAEARAEDVAPDGAGKSLLRGFLQIGHTYGVSNVRFQVPLRSHTVCHPSAVGRGIVVASKPNQLDLRFQPVA
jgi:hypothetical protein